MAGGALMSLPWVRLDSNVATNDKILALLDEKPPADAFRAAFSYVCSLGYSGGHGTDGLIRFAAVTFVHGNRRTAELLVKHHLWHPDPEGWRIPNWDVRQQSSAVTESIKRSRRAASTKGNCVRWHGADCNCWADSG
jgi:hypothetical protein